MPKVWAGLMLGVYLAVLFLLTTCIIYADRNAQKSIRNGEKEDAKNWRRLQYLMARMTVLYILAGGVIVVFSLWIAFV
ncbi:MAG: hypothetical protein ACI4FX_10740 [Agathobacter sp.]